MKDFTTIDKVMVIICLISLAIIIPSIIGGAP